MTSSIIAHLHFGGADLGFRKKFRLFFTVAVVVLALGCVKWSCTTTVSKSSSSTAC